MTLTKTLSALVASALLAGCSTAERTGALETAPLAPAPMKYKIINTIESTGSASAISPSFFRMPQLIREAGEIAVGEAIYERDDIDIVLNPKQKVEVTNYFLWATATVTIKGRGAAFDM